MKHSYLRVALASLFLILAGSALVGFSTQVVKNTSAATGAEVVVELFTSEGCSSCPPADALLARLSEQLTLGKAQVIALEEHVDYWDELGWKDPFSSHDWTARQYAYAGVLGNGNPYTPQMIVDGSLEFSGSREPKARQSIAEAAAQKKTTVTLSQGASSKPGAESFLIQVGRLSPSAKGGAVEVWLAITETGLHSSVTRGENAGHELRHAAIVRTMRKIGEAKADTDTSFSGNATVPLGKEWKRENLKVVVFVQEKKSLRILGAAEISLHS